MAPKVKGRNNETSVHGRSLPEMPRGNEVCVVLLQRGSYWWWKLPTSKVRTCCLIGLLGWLRAELDWVECVWGSKPGAAKLWQLALLHCTELVLVSACVFFSLWGFVFIYQFILIGPEKSNSPKTCVGRIVITCFNVTVTIMCFAHGLWFITAPINQNIMIMCKNICLCNDGTVRLATTRCPAQSSVWLLFCFLSLQEWWLFG